MPKRPQAPSDASEDEFRGLVAIAHQLEQIAAALRRFSITGLGPDPIPSQPPTIDINRDTLLSLQDVARRVGRSYETIRLWVKTGCRGIRLETVVVGGGRKTSEAALAEFVRKLTALSAAEDQSKREANQPTMRQREATSKRVAERLRQMGVDYGTRRGASGKEG